MSTAEIVAIASIPLLLVLSLWVLRRVLAGPTERLSHSVEKELHTGVFVGRGPAARRAARRGDDAERPDQG